MTEHRLTAAATVTANPEVFWLLPGPRKFQLDLTEAVHRSALVVIQSDPGAGVPGLQHVCYEAMGRGLPAKAEARIITIDDGTPIDSHVGVALGIGPLTGPQLRALYVSSVEGVLLVPTTDKAVRHCREYAAAFWKAPAEAGCNLTLVVLVAVKHIAWGDDIGGTFLNCSWALTKDEMRAYVTMRMVDRRGPGSTRLIQELVIEFARYDASVAECLLRMSQADLLDLPNSLDQAMVMMGRRESLWRDAREDYGTLALVGGQRVFHTLYDWYTSKHQGPNQEAAKKRLRTNYWLANVQSLMPWLESRRQEIIKILQKSLQSHLSATGGVFTRRRQLRDGTFRDEPSKEIGEMDFGDITSLAFDRPPYKPATVREQRAFGLCHPIIKVRNDIAHMRSPAQLQVMQMIEAADSFFGMGGATQI